MYQSSVISSQPMTFEDPLTLLPDEPRFTLQPLIPLIDLLIPENSISYTLTHNNQSFVASKNKIFVFLKY